MEMKVQKKLVVVEDSESIREAVVFALQESGYQVVAASNGQEATALFNGDKIDLLLTDFHMPEMNGLELIKWVRQKEEYKHMPVLVLTTENQRDVILQAKEAGATGWLYKPFVVEKLVQTIRRVVR